MTRRNHHRRVLRLVSRIVGRGPDYDGPWFTEWPREGEPLVVMTCHDCSTWWLDTGPDLLEMSRLRITRRARLALERWRRAGVMTEAP